MQIINRQNEWWEKNVPNRFNEFVVWLGTAESSTRKFMREFVISNNVTSILDTACGPCIDYEVLNGTGIKYSGVDSTNCLVKMAVLRGIDVRQANIEELPFENSTFDMVYGRHILEHLEYYEKAMKEAIRCAKKYVMYTFFLEHAKKDIIKIVNDVYTNYYNLNKMSEFIKNLGFKSTLVKKPNFTNQSILIIDKT